MSPSIRKIIADSSYNPSTHLNANEVSKFFVINVDESSQIITIATTGSMPEGENTISEWGTSFRMFSIAQTLKASLIDTWDVHLNISL